MTRSTFAPLLRTPLAFLAALALAACDGSTTGRDGAGDFAGRWSGTAALGGQGRTTTLDIRQAGTQVAGTITMTAVLPIRGTQLVGEVDANGVLTFAASYPEECRVVTGRVTRSGDELSGTAVLSQQSRHTPSGLSGSITLERD